MFVAILGRQSKLGLAELESIYGADHTRPAGNYAAVVESNELDITRLGGTVKVARVLTILDTTKWVEIEDYLRDTIPKHMTYVPEGKFRLGLSVYGLPIHVGDVKATALRLKKIVKATGRNVRVIPNKNLALGSAQVIHNQLTGPTGWELVLIKDGKKTILAQTTQEQDIEAYAARDQERPKRDAFVGMLPPKLAQIMVNLGSPSPTTRILDPFCGTGVILQEAALMGHAVYGTDLAEKMIRYSRDNLNWLRDSHHIDFDWYLHEGDAMKTEWQQPIDSVICETYLGQPFSAPPSPAKLAEVRRNCDHIVSDFLKNIRQQLKPGTRLCIAVPAWRDKTGEFSHLPLIEQVGELGYAHVGFRYISQPTLLYYREDQVVARELLVLIKK